MATLPDLRPAAYPADVDKAAFLRGRSGIATGMHDLAAWS
jgi:hypothetical protein